MVRDALSRSLEGAVGVAEAKTHWAELPAPLQEIEEAQLSDHACEELRKVEPRTSPGRVHYQLLGCYIEQYRQRTLNLITSLWSQPELCQSSCPIFIVALLLGISEG